jgi:hypothetical protein
MTSGSRRKGCKADDPMNTPDRDILISRIVDGVADERDWSSMDDLARADASIWRDLALAQRQHTELTGVVTAALAAADRTDLPSPDSFLIADRAGTWPGRVMRWTGWGVAAAIALAWVGGLRQPPTPGGLGNTAGTPAGFEQLFTTPADALRAYLQKGQDTGQVIGQEPQKLILNVTPAVKGGYEVIYIRQIVERAVVPELYEFTDETDTGHVEIVPVVIPLAEPSADQPARSW